MAKKKKASKSHKKQPAKAVAKKEVVAKKTAAPPAPAVMDTRVNVRTLSGFVGVTEQRVIQLYQEGIIPRGEDKLVDLRDGVKAYIDYLKNKEKENIGVHDETTGLNFKNYSERDNYYKSEERRINLLTKTGGLVHIPEVSEGYYALIEVTREAFLILPDVLEREADLTRKQIAKVQKFADKKLKSLSNIFDKVTRE